jgi:hypothetical protein
MRSLVESFLANRHSIEVTTRSMMDAPARSYALVVMWPLKSGKGCRAASGSFDTLDTSQLLQELFALPEGSIIAVYRRKP